MKKSPKILIVDDETSICTMVKFNLENQGFDVETANSAEDVLTMDLSDIDLVLLDIMMGDISGIQLANILKKRQDTKDLSIIFCTARDSEDDIVNGLELGADDYVTKPYSIRTLIARINAVLRCRKGNSSKNDDSRVFQSGSLIVNDTLKTCTVDGQMINLPRKEFEILVLLISNPGRPFSRNEILNRVWNNQAVVVDRVVDVDINRIRTKLGEYSKCIVTKPGYGYVFNPI